MRKSRLEEQREDLGVEGFRAARTVLSDKFLPIRDDFKRKLGALLRERMSSARPGVRMLSLEGGATQGEGAA